MRQWISMRKHASVLLDTIATDVFWEEEKKKKRNDGQLSSHDATNQTHESVGEVIERPKINMWWIRRLAFLFRNRKQTVKKLAVLNGGHVAKSKKIAFIAMRCQLIKNIQRNKKWILEGPAWQCTLFIVVDNFKWRFEIHCPVPTLYCYYIVDSTIHFLPQTRRSKISSGRTQTEIAGDHMR